MTTTQKALYGGLVVGVLAAMVVIYLFWPKLSFGASPSGSSFGTSKIAEQSIAVATDTIFALPNTDSQDRNISSIDVMLRSGAATSSLYTIQCATSTVTTGLNGNINYVFNSTFPVTYGTTTNSNQFYVATSSGGILSTTTAVVGSPPANYINNYARVWPTGSNLVCKLTNSGAGQNNLFDPLMTGFVAAGYRGT